MAVTSLDLDPELMQELKRVTHAKSVREAVTLSAQNTIRISRQLAALDRLAEPDLIEVLNRSELPKTDHDG